MHGAALARAIHALRPDVRFVGTGGDELAALTDEAGAPLFDARFHVRELSLMGLVEVFSHLPRIVSMLAAIRRMLAAERPDAVILLDAPDFNFLVARMAHTRGIPVFFYISPQVWAWRTGRVRVMQRLARRVLCILPFEKAFYERNGASAEFIGHPLMDEMDLPRLDAVQRDPSVIGILPGSRRREVDSLLPRFATAASLLQQRAGGGLTFRIIRAPGVDEATLRDVWAAHAPGVDVQVHAPAQRYTAMRGCGMILAASGTATLECALLGVPTVVTYTLSPLTYALARRIIDVKYVSLANLILDEEVLPELLQERAEPEYVAAAAWRWMQRGPHGTRAGGAAYEYALTRLATLRSAMGDTADMPGDTAAERGARIILNAIGALPT